MIYRCYAFIKGASDPEQLVLLDVRPFCIRDRSLHDHVRLVIAAAWCCEPELVDFYNLEQVATFIKDTAQGPESDGYARAFECAWGPDGIEHIAFERVLLLVRPGIARDMVRRLGEAHLRRHLGGARSAARSKAEA